MGYYRPDWPLPPGVEARVTTRTGGFSRGPYASFNLAQHVGDEPAEVAANRARLSADLALPAPPRWLEQVHGTTCVEAAEIGDDPPVADAARTSTPGVVCAVLTADCLPVLLCDDAGETVAAVHAGWRGLADGVLASALHQLPPPSRLRAWLGPGISGMAYAVGPELRERFVALDPAHDQAFVRREGQWYADLPTIAAHQLTLAGVTRIHRDAHCTHARADLFWSYRRDGVCGRFASLIWITPGT